MKTPLFFLNLLIVSCALSAKPPLSTADKGALYAEYRLTLRSQAITEAAVGSDETGHMAVATYALFPWLSVSAGLGGAKFETDPYRGRRFEGDYGLAPLAGSGWCRQRSSKDCSTSPPTLKPNT